MQTSQAVSAGGLFTPGSVEILIPENFAPTSPTVLAAFEQHLQQVTGGQTEPTRVLPSPAPEIEFKFVPSATLNPRPLAVPAAITFEEVQLPPIEVSSSLMPARSEDGERTEEPQLETEDPPITIDPTEPEALALVLAVPAAVTFGEAGLPPIEVTASPMPDRGDHGERTEEGQIETKIPPIRSEPREPEAPAIELAAAAAAATEVPTAARVVVTPHRTIPPQVEREAGRQPGANGPNAASVEGDRSRREFPGRALTVSKGDSQEIAPRAEPAPGVRRAVEAEARRSIDSGRLPRPATESGPPTTTQPAPEDFPEPISQPALRQPARESLLAPSRSNPKNREVGAMADLSEIERVQFGRHAERAVDIRQTSDVSRFQAGADETSALNATMFRRANWMALNGTAAAKPERSMDKGLEQNQFAGLPEQKLPTPGRNAVAAELRPLGERVLESVREAALDRPDKGINSLADAPAGRPASAIATGANGASAGLEATGGSAVRTAEQLLQNLTREVAQFKRYNAESMAVVLKPDAQTEIFLHLASRNGQIEIQARFERGDFASLNGQWAQLQQTLSQQGVRLSNLQEGFNQPPQQPGGGTEWGHGQMNQGQQRQAGRDAEDLPQKQAFEELMLRSSPSDAVKSPARARTTFSRANSMLEAWA